MIPSDPQSVLIIVGLTSLFLGAFFGLLTYGGYVAGIKKMAELEGADLVEKSKDDAELRLIDEKEKTQEIEEKLYQIHEKDFQRFEDSIAELESVVEERVAQTKEKEADLRKIQEAANLELQKYSKVVEGLETAAQQKKQNLQRLNTEYIQKVSETHSFQIDELKAALAARLLSEVEKLVSERGRYEVEETTEHSETLAKEIIARALNRFHRPYSSERGIASVYFETPDQRRILVDEKKENLKAIEALTGCEIFVEDDMDLVGVAGFDPVRRELTRRILERCLKEKRPINPAWITKIGDAIKRELLASIKKDGDQIARDLKINNFHPEIRQILGSLRYRYSFTQNQYFHVGEVGWLCYLLASELGTVNLEKARRSGVLHDLGKSMDHEIQGGHAVIGADFIEKRGEAEDVVYAVRAHHYDVPPTSNLDFLVIGADAISGARPGARRSTMQSYTQKVTELEAIAKSFDVVTDCFILNGGREARVLVDGRRIDDLKTMSLSAEIAQRIETELNYPGQIKVVVVRSTQVVESTTGGDQRNRH